MTVRERLNQLMKLNSLIDCKLAQYEMAKKACSVEFYSGKGKLLSEEINADIDRLCDEKQAIMKLIDNTASLTANETTVLYKHYLEGKSYDVIAKEMYYTKTTVFRICQKAIAKLPNI